MPLGFHRCHPARIPENSPAFQRRGKFRIAQVPQGRLNGGHVIRQLQYIETFPGVETPGYFHLVPPGPLAQSGTSQILILMILPPMILPVPW